jgi:hypothetical protein
VILRVPEIWRKARNARNSLAPINKLPPETLARVAAFLNPGRQLRNATAVCQHWRTILFLFPWLWNTIHCSNRAHFEVCLERSKPAPLEVQLHAPHFHLFEYLLPHTSRLVALAVLVNRSSGLGRIVQHLRNPIPTLHEFTIGCPPSGPDTLELPPDIGNSHFTHVKELQLEHFSSFQAHHAFPRVTKLTWHVGPRRDTILTQLSWLSDELGHLPALEEVHLVFRTDLFGATDPFPHVVTLPHVRSMSLSCSGDWGVGIPPILKFLKLPKLVSLVVDAILEFPLPFPVLPVTSFGHHLPNLAELPDMKVYTRVKHGQVTFWSPSQAMLEYRPVAQSLGATAYSHHRWLWGALPLHSVRRLTATLDRRAKGVEDVWLVWLLRDMCSLEHLELRGSCSNTLRRLRRLMMRGNMLRTKTLTVRSGTYEIRQAMRLKDVADNLGLGIIITCIPSPEVSDIGGWSPDADGLSESWDLSDEGGSDESESDETDSDETDSDESESDEETD